MSTNAPRSGGSSLWRNWFTNETVLRALFLRELQGSYGRHNIGFLWVVLEPLILASIVTTIHVYRRGSIGALLGLDPYTFTVTGYCLLIVFRSNFGRSANALQEAMTLMYHRQITAVDVMVARFLVNTLGSLTAFTILSGVGILFGLGDWPARPLYLFLGIAEISIWSFGLTMIVASYTHKYHVLHNFIVPISYFSFPLSGAFFTMNLLPTWARDIMAWNPMAAMFETARYGQFLMASPDYMFPGYVIAHCMLSVYWGFYAINRVRREIHVV